MVVSRYSGGKDGRSPYDRQKGRRCDMEVVPFGEVVLHRLPEVATDRPQALEDRWVKGVWLGHAMSSNTSLVDTDKGVIKALAIRRLSENEQWDGELIRKIVGTPMDWKLDANEDQQMVELGNDGSPEVSDQVRIPKSSRAGERRSMYLTKKDFESHGYTDGCQGCKDLASGRRGPVSGFAPHTTACRRRMESAIETADPARWERYLARRAADGPVAEGPSRSPTARLGTPLQPDASDPGELMSEPAGQGALQRTEASKEEKARKPGRQK